MVLSKSEEHFNNNIRENLQMYSKNCINSYNKIYNDFIFYRKISKSLFTQIHKYTEDNTSPSDSLEHIFIHQCKNQISLEEIMDPFFKEINAIRSALENGIMDENQLQIIKNVSDLIFLVYSQEINEFIEAAKSNVMQYSKNFIMSENQKTPTDYAEDSLSTLKREKQITDALFKIRSFDVYSVLYKEILNNSNYNSTLELMGQYLNSRDTSLFEKCYKLLTFCKPSQNLIFKFNKAVDVALCKEPYDAPLLNDAVNFYIQNIENLIDDVKRSVDLAATRFINKSPKEMLKSVMKYINSTAKSKCDLSKISTVLKRLSNKGELEYLHTRNATKRLLPLNNSQIEREFKLVYQMRDLSKSFEFRALGLILTDARKSLELHLGPVLFVQAPLWPFRPPYPRPVKLAEMSSAVFEKYKQMHPSRKLFFPLNAWVVSIKYKNVVLVGNGVQAEGLLLFNNKNVVTESELSPAISDATLRAALKSMSTTKCPILIENDSKWTVNEKYDGKGTVKIPIPVVDKNAMDEEVLAAQKLKAVDAAIARVLKRRNIMTKIDLIKEARSELLDKFKVPEQDLNSRIGALASQSFIDVRPDGLCVYMP